MKMRLGLIPYFPYSLYPFQCRASTSVAPMDTTHYIYTRQVARYHDMYMGHFDILNQNLADIRTDLYTINVSVQPLTQSVEKNHYEVMQFLWSWNPYGQPLPPHPSDQ